LTIKNRKGLHARASAKMVQLAASFQSEITVSRDGVRVVGTSIMGLLMLAAAPGCVIEVSATGPDATAALDAIEALVNNRFDESE
jgi:phosphocarrier protein